MILVISWWGFRAFYALGVLKGIEELKIDDKIKKIEFKLTRKIENETKDSKESILLVQGSDFHEGVIGIVASRIKDKYNKPCQNVLKYKNMKVYVKYIYYLKIVDARRLT